MNDRANYRCHECGERFADELTEWVTYAFTRCPACGSAKTTLA